jgi:hypothetical protein
MDYVSLVAAILQLLIIIWAIREYRKPEEK